MRDFAFVRSLYAAAAVALLTLSIACGSGNQNNNGGAGAVPAPGAPNPGGTTTGGTGTTTGGSTTGATTTGGTTTGGTTTGGTTGGSGPTSGGTTGGTTGGTGTTSGGTTAGTTTGGTTTGGTTGGQNPPTSTFIFVRNGLDGKGLPVLRLNENGSIEAVAGSPFPFNAQSLGVAGHHLVAGDRKTITAYAVDPKTGMVTPTSTAVAGSGSIAGDDKFVYAGRDAIYGYAFRNGALTPLPGFPFGADPPGTCDCASSFYSDLALYQGYLFYSLSRGHGGSGFGVKKIQADGTFSDINRESCNAGSSSGPSARISVTPNAKFIYETSSGFSSLQLIPFDPGSATLGCSESSGGENLFDSGVIDPSSRFLAATQNFSGQAIGIYRIDPNTGHLSVASSTPSKAFPEAIDPTGKYLLTLESSGSGNWGITVYTIEANTGTITRVSNFPLAPTTPEFVADELVVGQF